MTLASSITVKLNKADSYDATAREKSDEARVAREKARNLRISAGCELADARKRVALGEAGDITWKDWCKLNVPGRSERTIRQILRLGKSDDPIAEDQRQREQNAERVKNHRAATRAAASADNDDRHYDDDVMPAANPFMVNAKHSFRRLSIDERGAFIKWVRETGLYPL